MPFVNKRLSLTKNRFVVAQFIARLQADTSERELEQLRRQLANR